MNINTLHKNLVKRANALVAAAGKAGAGAAAKATADAAKVSLAQKLLALLGKGKDEAITFSKNRWQGVKNDWNEMLHAEKLKNVAREIDPATNKAIEVLENRPDWLRRALGGTKLTAKGAFPIIAANELLKDDEAKILEDSIKNIRVKG